MSDSYGSNLKYWRKCISAYQICSQIILERKMVLVIQMTDQLHKETVQ